MERNAGTPLFDDCLYLIGRPPLADFIRSVRRRSVGGPALDEASIAHAWRRAGERIRELESSEAGAADHPQMEPLPESIISIAENALDDPVFFRARHYVRQQWWLIELDRLVISQKVISLRFVEEIKAHLPRAPTMEDLIKIACGRLIPPPAVQVSQPSDNTWTFTSGSEDLRFLDVAPLKPDAQQVFQPSGRARDMLAIFVGFGHNFISASQLGTRLVLNNGSHRAFALRELGFTHVPCLVTHVSQQDELELAAPTDVKKNVDLYLRNLRPPLFRDYFDERQRLILSLPRHNNVVQVRLTFDRQSAPVLP